MQGWMDRSQNQNGIVALDQDFDSAGQLKEKRLYLRTTGSDNETIRNIFVFDSKGQLIRGNVTISEKESFVIVNPDMVFLNGQPSHLSVVASALQKRFKVSSSLPIMGQIQKIWDQQNTAPAAVVPRVSTPSAQ